MPEYGIMVRIIIMRVIGGFPRRLVDEYDMYEYYHDLEMEDEKM